MIAITGKSGVGKTSIVREMVKQGYEKIVTCTTRPPRPNEVNGRDYKFIDERTFRECIDDGVFAEYKVYHTGSGDWYYGSIKSDLENATDRDVIILTPEGVRDISKNSKADIKVVYIDAGEETIKKRLEHRGDDPAEIKRRMRKDFEDFKDFLPCINYIIANDGNRPIDAVVKELIERTQEES